MTLRELMDQISPDHQFTLWKKDIDFRIPGIYLTLKCSCGWKAQRIVTDREMYSDYASILQTRWQDWAQLQHLLDQEVVAL